MPLSPGTTLGPYRITAKIGAGGMGEVYRARDTKLDRDVALKVLPQAFTEDPDRLARFEREAKVLASLHHPNIGGIHGLEESEGVKALVLEYIDGPTLADRIAQGAIPLDEALPIAKQIAEALEAAHEQGIIHRDLKPANIKLKPDGTVKVLDFGLAKAVTERHGTVELPAATTVTVEATARGVILGTIGYMSPEQTRGRPLDRRTDIWSFGCVLYEMLCGRRPFMGETRSDSIAAVLSQSPHWGELPPHVPLLVTRVLRKCLEKDPKRRLRDVGDTITDLDDAMSADSADVAVGPVVRNRPTRRWSGVVAVPWVLLLALAFVVLSRPWREDSTYEPLSMAGQTVSTRLTNYGGTERHSALSPDGRSFAFVSDHDGGPDIWLRQVAGGDLVRLTDDAAVESHLVYAPDGETIFFERLAGGATAIWRVGALGGQASQVVSNAGRPEPSPDGRRLAYYVAPANLVRSLVVSELNGSETRVLVEQFNTGSASFGSGPSWSPDGRYLSYIDGALFAPHNLSIVDTGTGEARQITQFVAAETGIVAQEWLPDNRHLAVVYQPKPRFGGNDLGVLDVDSGAIRRLTLNVTQAFSGLSVSADGSRLVAAMRETGREVWRVPFGPDPEANGRDAVAILDAATDPWWTFVSRDGRTLLFNSASGGSRNLWTLPLDGSTFPRQITTFPGDAVMHSSLSPDGERVAFIVRGAAASDVWVQRVDGTELEQLTADEAADSWPVWSPDGQWIAYTSIRGGVRQTWRVPSAGGPSENLTDGFFRGDWMGRADGTTWLVTSNGGTGVRMLDAEDGHLVWETLLPGSSVTMPMFSPDGRLVSAALRERDGRGAIWVLDAETGAERPAVRFPGPFLMQFRAGWSGDGTAFIVNRLSQTRHVFLYDEFWSGAG